MKRILCILTLVFIALACEKVRSYPDVPEISHKSHTLSSSKDLLGNNVYLLEFAFDFVDGDGDLSFPESLLRSADSTDTSMYSTFSYEIFVKNGGSFAPYIPPRNSVSLFSSFLPWEDFMSRDGQNKTFKGTMIKRIEFYQPFPFDTFKVSYFVTDFLYHKSNVVEIPEELVLK